MKRLLFIINPCSGKGRIRNKLLSVLDIFAKRGYRVETYVTQEAWTPGARPSPGGGARISSSAAEGRDPQRGGFRHDGAETAAGSGIHSRRVHQRLRRQPGPSQADRERRPPGRGGEGIPRGRGEVRGRPVFCVYCGLRGVYGGVLPDAQDKKNLLGHQATCWRR